MKKKDLLELWGLAKFLFTLAIISAAGWLGGWKGSLLAIVAVIAVLYAASRFLFVAYDVSRRMAFRALLAVMFGMEYPYFIVEDGRIARESEGKLPLRIGGPGLAVIRPGNAVVFERGGKCSKISGPGLEFTERFEFPKEVVDLRMQVRSQNVHALTKDGIPVDITASVFFKIKAGDQEPSEDNLFPFSRKAVREAVYGKAVVEAGDLKWHEIIPFITAVRLRDIISRKYLDELYEPFDRASDPREVVRAELLREAKKTAPRFGVDIIGVNIGTFEIPQEAIQQTTEAWQAEWKRHIARQDAQVEYDVARLRAKTSADAIDMVFRAAEMAQDREVHEAIILRYIQALEEMVKKAGTVIAMPDILRALAGFLSSPSSPSIPPPSYIPPAGLIPPSPTVPGDDKPKGSPSAGENAEPGSG